MTAFVKRKAYQRHLNELKQQQKIYKSTEYGKLKLQTDSSVDIHKINLISKFSVDSEVAFVSYARFTGSYCCIGHHVSNYYVDTHNKYAI